MLYCTRMTSFRKIFSQYLRLLAYAKPYRGRLASGIIFSALFGASNTALLFVVKKVWASVFERRACPDPAPCRVVGLAVSRRALLAREPLPISLWTIK